MRRFLAAPVLVSICLLTGCTTYVAQYSVGSDDYVLASRTGADGSRETFRLQVRSSVGDASLRVISEHDRVRPFLGLQLQELDKASAERRGVRPYSGLLVTDTYPKSSAAGGGVMAGDVLLSLDKREMVYLPQVAEFESTLREDQVVTAKVLRGQSELDLSLSTNLLQERVADDQEVPLESVALPHRPYAGVTLRGIPTVWCERIYGVPRNAIVVTSVEVGSPAWLAGVRGGDVIEEVDGGPVPPVAELSRRIGDQGAAGQSMRWRLRRGPGPEHDATVELSDYSGEMHFWIPLIFHLEAGAYSDVWSLGPFGVLLRNRNHYVANTSTRAVQTRNVFHALLGLIRVESGPDETDVRLLWLIHFDT